MKFLQNKTRRSFERRVEARHKPGSVYTTILLGLRLLLDSSDTNYVFPHKVRSCTS